MSKTRVAPTNLTTGYPSWDGSGNLSVTGNLTATNISAGNNLTVTGSISSGSNLTVTSTISATGGINSPIGFGTNGPTGSYTYFDRNGGGTAGAVFRTNGVNQLWDYNYGTVIAYTSAGNVGIGTTTPNKTLTVVGNISATGIISSPTTAKAWVNFNGVYNIGVGNASSTMTLSVTSGSSTGTWTDSANGWSSSHVGMIFKITQIGGVANATFGGVDVSTLGIQITAFNSAGNITFKFLSGTASASQSVNGTGSGSSGFSFNATGIRSSYNVSSITKNATGDYTVNFATPMADANYSVIGSCAYVFPSSASYNTVIPSYISAPTVNSARIGTGFSSTTTDMAEVCVAIFGN
jgi:hypothetical protein